MLHNPDKLTAEQIETDKGYRLLEDFEIQMTDNALYEIELWGLDKTWLIYNRGCSENFTYRTKLSPRDLHMLRSNCGQMSLPQREALEPKSKTITHVTLPTWFVYFMAISTTLAFAILGYLLSHL